MPASAPDLLIFLHLPKAGGTTLRELIGRQYPPDRTVELKNNLQIDADLEALGPTRREYLRALSGHVRYGVHEHFPQPSTYFTFLRHPVDRLASHYAYVRRRPLNVLYEPVNRLNLTLLEYVTSDLTEELTNDLTRRLAGLPVTVTPTADDLATAKRHLATHFCVAGVVERFDESLLLLAQARNWQRPYYLARNVAADQRPAIVTPAERDAILVAQRSRPAALCLRPQSPGCGH